MTLGRERMGVGARVPPWVRNEHLQRFHYVAGLLHGRVVDCACGDGTGTAHFAPACAELRAFDASEDAVAATRARALDGVMAEVADATSLPLPDSWADAYVSLETVEHIDDDAAFVREAARVVRPGGLFVCSTPNRVVTNPGARLADAPFNPFHVREYTTDELCDLLEPDFAVAELLGQNPRPLWRAAAMERVAAAASPQLAVRANQVAKLPRFVRDPAADHAVRRREPDAAYEYLLAVCRRR